MKYLEESVGQTAKWISLKCRQIRERRRRFAIDNVEFHVSGFYIFVLIFSLLF